MARILGLDISSTTIGIAVLDLNEATKQIKVIDYDHYKPIKKGNILDRLIKTQKDIKKIIEQSKPDHIAIEDIVSFMGGGSTAQTIITLASFNRMIGLLAYQHLGRSPELFNVMSIRHGLKLTKELPPKEQMPEILAQHLGIKFQYLYKKNDEIASESYDRADALAVATYYAFVLSGKIIRKEKSKSKKVKKKK